METLGSCGGLAARGDFESRSGVVQSNAAVISSQIGGVRPRSHSRRRLSWSLNSQADVTCSCCWNRLASKTRWNFGRHGARRNLGIRASVYENILPAPQQQGSSGTAYSSFEAARPATLPTSATKSGIRRMEEFIEQSIFNCRFLTLMGVGGSLAGSVLCFLKGCSFVLESFREYFYTCWQGSGTGKVVLLLVEAVDVYLMGTVMLIFGMGLYELFVSSLDVPGGNCNSTGIRTTVCGSNLFGLFRLRERPKWLEIHSLDELKTKLGHVIVMILLVGMFEKSKKVPIHSGVDLLCFSASILLSSGCLFLLSKLHSTT